MTDAESPDPPARPSPLRALIVDDEPLARERIRELLNDEDAVVVAGEAQDGEEAIEQIETLALDLVFLDVQMPGASGIEVVDAVGAADMPLTIFVTAYDQYAIKAFEVAAVDYLLKPFDDERFAEAVERAQQRLEEQETRKAAGTLRRLLQAHENQVAGDDEDRTSQPLERIAVQKRGQTRIVPVDAVTHITADGSYAEIHTADGTHIIRERMKTLAERLDPDAFMRIHRSAIVRLDAVDAILHGGGGDYAVRLHDDTRLSLSRSRVEALRERLGVNEL
jgi:two-component system LytT family response regulator